MAEFVGSVSNKASYYKYYIDVSESNVDVANNTSVVTATSKIYTNYSGTLASRSASATHTITIDGTDYTITTGAYKLGGYNTVTLGSASKTIKHNADGSKNVSVSANSPDLAQGNGWGPYSGSVSGTMALTTIPRASSVTCADGNIGSSTTININRASSSFTHTLKYWFGSLSGTIINKTSNTSIGWSIPTTFYSQIPNATNGQGTISCETYNGDTLIGTKTCTFNAFVINSNPTISAIIEDSNETTIALTGDKNKLVKYFSNATVVITATAKNSASIKSQKVVCGDGKSSTTATSTLNKIESGSFTVSTTDSRNLSSSVIINKALIEYVKLAFTEITLARTSTTSNTVNATVKGNYFNNNFGKESNTLELKWRYRTAGGTWNSYNTVTATISQNTFAYTATLGTNFDFQQEYEFEFVVVDKLITESSTKILTQGLPIIDIGKNDVNVNGTFTAVKFNGPLDGSATTATRVVNRGNIAPETGTTKTTYGGISMQTSYNNGYPTSYGNVLNLLGGGQSQLYLGWEGNTQRGKIFYRSIRDVSSNWSQWGEIFTGRTLYDNSSGSKGTITLSESAADFSYLEIYYFSDSNTRQNCIKVFSPNGKQIHFSNPITTSSIIYWYLKRANISGTSITVSYPLYANLTGANVSVNATDNIYITAVVGYR